MTVVPAQGFPCEILLGAGGDSVIPSFSNRKERRMTKQLGFAEAFSDSRLGTNKKLEEIDRLIDWSALEPLAKRVRSGEIGRPPAQLIASDRLIQELLRIAARRGLETEAETKTPGA